jgi:hypothetical protein
VPAAGGIVALPLYLFGILQADWAAATCLLALAGFFQYASLGPTFGVVQNVAGRRRRATATALLYICLNVFALGGGPLFTGSVIDSFAQSDFQRLDTRLESRNAGDTSFKVICPGGAAIATADAVVKSACNATLARATRQGMLLTLLFFGWASIHYFLASAGIAKALKAASLQDAAAFASSVQSDSM